MATILDLTRLSAAYATRLLAEAGHRVVRVEPPAGDDVRRHAPFLHSEADLEHGAYHQFLNAGKESLALDTASAAARSVLRALVSGADAVIATRPLPLRAAELLALQPRLVLVEVDDVPNELAAYARSGLLSLTGHPGERPAVAGGHAVLSAVGLYVAVAAAAGLYAVASGAPGGHVEVSAAHCIGSLAEQAALTYHTTGRAPGRRGMRGAVTAVSGAFACADGYWMISVPHNPAGWARFMEWVGDPELAADASLADEGRRLERRDEILERLARWSSRFTKDELVRGAQERHIPAAPVATPLDLARDPQLLARGFLRPFAHPALGELLWPVGATGRFADATLGAAPRLGAHTAAILDELGYDAAERAVLVELGAVS
jgi:formyl-CoA transferase